METYFEIDNAIIAKDGSFKLSAPNEKCQKVIIEVEDKSGIMYLDTATSEYFINFPSRVTDERKTYRKSGKTCI